MGEEMDFGGMHFPNTGCHVPDTILQYWNIIEMMNIWASVSTFIQLFLVFCLSAFFSNNGLHNLAYASLISNSHTKLGIISRGVPGLATDFPGWIDRQLYGGSNFNFVFLKLQLMYKFGIVKRIFYWFLALKSVCWHCSNAFYYFPFYSEVFLSQVLCMTILSSQLFLTGLSL